MTNHDLETCFLIVSFAKTQGDDLPDGMAEEILESYQDYKESKNKESLIDSIKEICQDWGFPFN